MFSFSIQYAYVRSVMTDEELLFYISGIKLNGFFALTEISKRGEGMPIGVEEFLQMKAKDIIDGVKTKKFVYSNGGWRLVFTLFPTNEVVEERYAVKNKVMSVMKKKL